jgi:hypothetical protein
MHASLPGAALTCRICFSTFVPHAIHTVPAAKCKQAGRFVTDLVLAVESVVLALLLGYQLAGRARLLERHCVLHVQTEVRTAAGSSKGGI